MTRAGGLLFAFLSMISALWLVGSDQGRAGGGTQAEGRQVITVRIENAAGNPIRCVALLAHFVTRTLPVIQARGEVEITLLRDPKSGDLSYGSHGDHPMMLENLLCGIQSDWTATSRDLPILSMRSDRTRRFDYRCALVGQRMVCELR